MRAGGCPSPPLGYGFAGSILYQRGIYPPEQFERKQKYGLTLLVTQEPELKKYINSVLMQLNGTNWLRPAPH